MVTAFCISVSLNVLFLGWLLYGVFSNDCTDEDVWPICSPADSGAQQRCGRCEACAEDLRRAYAQARGWMQ